MLKKHLIRAYKRLNIQEYTRVIKDTLIPYFDDYDGEFVMMLTPKTKLTIEPHFYNGDFYGWNIKADGKLLETRDTKKQALRFLRKLRRGNQGRRKTS